MSYTQDAEEAVGGSGEDWLSNGQSRAQAAKEKFEDGASGPVWLKKTSGASLEVISRDNSTAQMWVCMPLERAHRCLVADNSHRDPLRFCAFLLDECLKRGVKLHQPAKATAVTRDENGQLTGVKITENGKESEIMSLHIPLLQQLTCA
jgi:glycine/D-amino acid oxidase-like deaminating enzyme